MERITDLQRGPRPRTTITLVCLFCSARTTIHVYREHGLPETLLWECIECQKEEPAVIPRKGTVYPRNHSTS